MREEEAALPAGAPETCGWRWDVSGCPCCHRRANAWLEDPIRCWGRYCPSRLWAKMALQSMVCRGIQVLLLEGRLDGGLLFQRSRLGIVPT